MDKSRWQDHPLPACCPDKNEGGCTQILSSLPKSKNGYRYVLVMCDLFTKWTGTPTELNNLATTEIESADYVKNLQLRLKKSHNIARTHLKVSSKYQKKYYDIKEKD
ncbi:hypothetical protein CHS0354_026332 [Potamilus streckersoni]|uniref:Uncharacterized protein n=1 Tax=Potamilus streckersoni TaxID=2493646 RepID=A0AAE0T2X8_9BIVA|nr:hypothetical protein CHS0354_026332 [Potamilus streckersoni]